jgi:ribose transport system substrate-binding protein
VIAAPPSNAPKGVKNKKVWVISCGQQYATCAAMTASFKAAGSVLGWNVTIYNGNASNTSSTNDGVEQAVADHVSAIVPMYADCPTIKSGLLAAKAAKIPVVSYGGVDCSNPTFGSQAPLFTAETQNPITAFQVRAQGDVSYILSRLTLEGVKKPKILLFEPNDEATHVAFAKEFDSLMKTKCPACTVTNEFFAESQVPNPAAANWKSEVLSHPGTNVIAFDSNSWIVSGLGTAAKLDHTKGVIVCCGDDNSSSGISLIKTKQITAINMADYSFFGWATANALNEVFAGVKPSKIPDTFGDELFFATGHNLPSGNQAGKYPSNYIGEYTKLWTGK